MDQVRVKIISNDISSSSNSGSNITIISVDLIVIIADIIIIIIIIIITGSDTFRLGARKGLLINQVVKNGISILLHILFRAPSKKNLGAHSQI